MISIELYFGSEILIDVNQHWSALANDWGSPAKCRLAPMESLLQLLFYHPSYMERKSVFFRCSHETKISVFPPGSANPLYPDSISSAHIVRSSTVLIKSNALLALPFFLLFPCHFQIRSISEYGIFTLAFLLLHHWFSSQFLMVPLCYFQQGTCNNNADTFVRVWLPRPKWSV